MIVLSNRFDRLDEVIADAALGSISWSEALAELLPLTGADGLSMDLIFGDNRMVRSLGAVGFDQSMVDAYGEYYHLVDPRMSFVAKFTSQGVIFDDDLQRPAVPAGSSEFWDWLDRSNAPGDASVLFMPCVGDARIALAVHRAVASPDKRDIVEFFKRFYDKLGAVNAMLRRQPPAEDQANRQAYPLLSIDCFTFGVNDDLYLRDADDLIRYRLPLTGLGRVDQDGRLTDAQPAFQSMLLGLLMGGLPQNSAELTFKTPLSETMVRASAAPDPGQGRQRHVRVRVTYLKHNVEAVKVFMTALGLTRRQAELLEAMRKVHKLEDAAEMLAISRNTARVFLAQMFERTGVHGKPELLQLADRFV